MSSSIWWFVAFAVVCALRPAYAMWFKKRDPTRLVTTDAPRRNQ